MSTIVVVGAGPVGLATADQLSIAGRRVVLVCPVADGSRSKGAAPIRETYQAAAAFWTPFSSGATPSNEKRYSMRTLDFYRQFQGAKNSAAGVIWRTVEQFWQKGTLVDEPGWHTNAVHFCKTPHGEAYETRPGAGIEWRCELSYSAPVIQVDKFRRWYLERLEKQGVTIESNWRFPLTRRGAPEQTAEGDDAWRQLLNAHGAEGLVICAGAGSVYFKLLDENLLPPSTVAFRKGVVARIEAKPADDEPVILYEGGAFIGDMLYLVPHDDLYVLGGTAHAVGAKYQDDDWAVTNDERQGILARAAQFLPDACQAKLADAGLWSPAQDGRIQWRVGVRPMLANHGPFFDDVPGMADQLRSQIGRPIHVFAHFGHGGSGFTLCQDTAYELVQKIQKTLPLIATTRG